MNTKLTEQDKKDVIEFVSNDVAIANMYTNAVDIGTEEITSEDLNTPVLKLIQSGTDGIENKKVGWYYRTDTNQQIEYPEVNFVYVTTVTQENYNKNGTEKVKIYYGFYAGTKEPFKMYVRGWSQSAHRAFQSEVGMWKNRLNVPMLALTVQLSSEEVSGTTDKGVKYVTNKSIFTTAKEKNGKPIVEMNVDRITFLVEAANRFKELASTPSANDDAQNDMPFK